MSQILPSSRFPLFILFIALIVTFIITRLVTAQIRRGSHELRNWSIGGVHVHHQVFGILIMLLVGGALFTYAPTGTALDVLAGCFGAGAALTLDEFALWLRLDDVYWTAQGRASIDAIFIAVALTGLLLVGATPLGASDPFGAARVDAAIALGVNLALTVITFLKGKPVLGALGLLLPAVSLIGALRLAKPHSQWAHWRYRQGSRRRERAERRFGAAYNTRWNRVRDALGRMSSSP